MTCFIDQLRRTEALTSIAGAHANSGDINGLRIAAAGALIELATTLAIARAHLSGGGNPQDPYVKTLLTTARDIIRDGGCIDSALDIDPEMLPEDCLPRQLLRLSSAPGVPLSREEQTNDRLTAATKLAIIDDGLTFMIRQISKLRRKDLINAIDTISKRCWSLHTRDLSTTDEHSKESTKRKAHEQQELC
jgi:hypothetical protein